MAVKVRYMGIPALVVLNSCSNFMGFTISKLGRGMGEISRIRKFTLVV